jgi:hypothetical protein
MLSMKSAHDCHEDKAKSNPKSSHAQTIPLFPRGPSSRLVSQNRSFMHPCRNPVVAAGVDQRVGQSSGALLNKLAAAAMLLLVSSPEWAQVKARQEFEVATVKVNRDGRGGSLVRTPGGLTATNAEFDRLIGMAFQTRSIACGASNHVIFRGKLVRSRCVEFFNSIGHFCNMPDRVEE